MKENKQLSTINTFMDNVIRRLKTKKTVEDEIDILYFMRGICRELQYYTRKDKKQSKSFSDRAKVFQSLMTIKRKQAQREKNG